MNVWAGQEWEDFVAGLKARHPEWFQTCQTPEDASPLIWGVGTAAPVTDAPAAAASAQSVDPGDAGDLGWDGAEDSEGEKPEWWDK